MVFKKSLCPCALDESRLDIGRVNIVTKTHFTHVVTLYRFKFKAS